jgi:hypothetical protein
MVAAGLVSILAAGIATGSLFLILEPGSGPAGTEVTGRTGSSGAFAAQVDPLAAYLVASAAGDAVTTADDPDLVRIGELVVDSAGNGQISFHVPDVEPGMYVLMVNCPSCALGSGGRTMLAVADFEVISSSPNTAASRTSAGWPPVGPLGAGLLAAAFTLIACGGSAPSGRHADRR